MEINGIEVDENIKYSDLSLSPAMMQALADKGYVQATPVQGGSIPSLLEWKDVLAKAVGSRNPINLVRATIKGRQSMHSPGKIAAKRGKKVGELLHG